MFDNFSPNKISLPPTKMMLKRLTAKNKLYESIESKPQKAKLIIYENSVCSESNTISSLIKSYYNGYTHTKRRPIQTEHPHFPFEYEYKGQGKTNNKQQPKSKSMKMKIENNNTTNSFKASSQLGNKDELKKVEECFINRTNFNFDIKAKKTFLRVHRSPPLSRSIQFKQKRNNLWIRRKKSNKVINLMEKKQQIKTEIRGVTPWSPRRKLIWKTQPDEEIEESLFYLPIY